MGHGISKGTYDTPGPLVDVSLRKNIILNKTMTNIKYDSFVICHMVLILFFNETLLKISYRPSALKINLSDLRLISKLEAKAFVLLLAAMPKGREESRKL